MRRPRRRPPTAARPRRRRPGGNRRTRAPRAHATVRGLPWFSAEQWERLRAVSEDRAELAEDYATWLADNEAAFDGLTATGMNVRKVLVDVDELTSWCRANNLRVDADSRPAFVNHLLSTRRAQVVE